MADPDVRKVRVPDQVVTGRRTVWGSFRRNVPALVGLAVLVGFLVLAVAAPLVTPYDPIKQDLSQARLAPSLSHVFGTDNLGRDIFTRIIYGARISLVIGLLAVAVGLVVGVPLGLVSGYFGRWVDIGVQRLADIMLAFPPFLLALAMVAALGIGIRNVIIAVGISVIPVFIRLTRGSALTIRTQGYVEAARAENASNGYIIVRHVLPNALAPVIVQATLSLGITILTASGLGFLGVGVQQPTPEWGSMLGDARHYIFSDPTMAMFPGFAIVLGVLAFNLIGDGLRDALDPHLRTF
ncbi:MAG TPA: ABC transporter permease [Micromonosporaceae bacterium]|nr:ABC transporter permease [Micromonosporaceae bacterium]